jgi:hypothetical protein
MQYKQTSYPSLKYDHVENKHIAYGSRVMQNSINFELALH